MSGQSLLVVGSYTHPLGSGDGLTTFARDTMTGALHPRAELPLESPSYLASHPRLSVFYAVSETEHGVVSTFEIGPDGRLEQLARCSSGGAFPCHCAVTADGAHLIVCNYRDGTVAVLPLDRRGVAAAPLGVVRRSGAGPDPDRQEASHPHQALDLADGTFLVADLGTDEVVRHRCDEAGPPSLLETVAMPPGTGPRQVAMLSAGSRASRQAEPLVVVGELASTLTYLPSGIHTEQVTHTTTAAYAPGDASSPHNYPAHVEVAPGGRVLYLSNRGADCISSFAVDDDGLRFVDQANVGTWPRHFAVVGPFLYMAAERGHAIDLVRADHRSGSLERVGEVAHIASPACALAMTVPT